MSVNPNLVLFDGQHRDKLLPLTYTRPVANIRVGITTLKEKWEFLCNTTCSYLTREYLSSKYPAKFTDRNIFKAHIERESIPSLIHTLDDFFACISVAEKVLDKD